ncbi:MAG: riboflavin biosynthesis protein RibF [Clostridia bacterium]|nr:riboflavin biosynthesis protein RibF [Clostridia bacterium]
MLEIVKFGQDEYNFPCLVVLGCFDGLHLGHSELLKKAKLQAKINGLDLGVMMFANGKEGKQICSFEERIALLEKYNVKFVLKVDYNNDFKQIKPLEFLDILEEHLNVKAYMSGKDFRFGEGAKGKSSTLKSFAEDEDNGVWYMPIKDVLIDGEKVSTSAIKTLIEQGDVKKAKSLLGRNYSVSGVVIHGADRGEKVIGYPTINLEYPENKVEVKTGVYAVRCTFGENRYYGIANYGPRPTFGEENNLLEVYLDGFEGTLYDETVTVEFIEYLRDIEKFDGAEALGAQLKNDLEKAREEAEKAEAELTAVPAPVTPVAPATPAPAEVKEAVAEVTAEAEVAVTSETTEEVTAEVQEEVKEEPAPAPEESKDDAFEAELEEEVPTVSDVIGEKIEEVAEETAEEIIEIPEVAVEPTEEIAEPTEVIVEPAEEVKEDSEEEQKAEADENEAVSD